MKTDEAVKGEIFVLSSAILIFWWYCLGEIEGCLCGYIWLLPSRALDGCFVSYNSRLCLFEGLRSSVCASLFGRRWLEIIKTEAFTTLNVIKLLYIDYRRFEPCFAAVHLSNRRKLYNRPCLWTLPVSFPPGRQMATTV